MSQLLLAEFRQGSRSRGQQSVAPSCLGLLGEGEHQLCLDKPCQGSHCCEHAPGPVLSPLREGGS